jgi:hypothetical protein
VEAIHICATIASDQMLVVAYVCDVVYKTHAVNVARAMVVVHTGEDERSGRS